MTCDMCTCVEGKIIYKKKIWKGGKEKKKKKKNEKTNFTTKSNKNIINGKVTCIVISTFN